MRTARRWLRRIGRTLLLLSLPPAATLLCFAAARLPALPLPPQEDAEVPVLQDGVPTTLVVRGGRIAALRPGVKAAQGGRLRHVLPGLIDAHVHSPLLPGDHALYDTLYLLHGITAVRNLGDGNQSLGRKAHRAGQGAGPRIFSCGLHIDGPPGVPFIARAVRTPEEARAAVAEQVRLGADCIKVFAHLSAESYAALREAAHAAGLPVVGHMVSAVGIEAARMDDVQHLTGVPEGPSPGFGDEEFAAFYRAWDSLPPARVARVIEVSKRDGVVHTPTLVGPAHVARALGDPAVGLLPSWYRGFWGELDRRVKAEERAQAERNLPRYLAVVGALHRAGVPVQAGSDVFLFIPHVVPGASLHEEMKLLVRAGLTPREAIASATEVPGRLLRREKGIGRLEVGGPADFGLYGADPRLDLGNLTTLEEVHVAGRRYLRSELEAHLKRQLAKAERGPYAWAAWLLRWGLSWT